MGLDMYLEAEHYVSPYDDKGKALGKVIRESVGCGLEGYTPKNVTFELGYWRKANAIHGWFVDNVQDGLDDCESHYVPIEKLRELKEICTKVLGDINLAIDLLPTTKGFFFGEASYDDYYRVQLERTLDILDKVLSTPNVEDWWITYRASW
jgi:hypothetical protein